MNEFVANILIFILNRWIPEDILIQIFFPMKLKKSHDSKCHKVFFFLS